MTRHDDAGWDRLLARVDLDLTSLAAAEERLRAADAVQPPPALPTAWIENLVAQATAAPATPPILRALPRVRRLSRVAAALLGACLLAAATTLYLIWPEGQRSSKTMSYPQAIALLSEPGQPDEDRRSALGQTMNRVTFGVRTLVALRDDVSTPVPLAIAARENMARLLLLAQRQVASTLTRSDDALIESARLARDPTLPLEERLRNLAHVANLTSNGVVAITAMGGLSPALAELREEAMVRLKRLCER